MTKVLRVPAALRKEAAYERAERALQKRYGSAATPIYEGGQLVEVVVLEGGRPTIIKIEEENN